MEAVLHGPSGRTVLGAGVMTIGRASDNRLVVIDRTASSHHAEIRPGLQGYSLIDVGSTNGTFVNGRILDRQVPHLLQGGDEIFALSFLMLERCFYYIRFLAIAAPAHGLVNETDPWTGFDVGSTQFERG